MRFWSVAAPAALLTLAIPIASRAEQGAVNFQRDIRAILSDACFHCHGPDEASRMAGLRLDTKEGAFAERPRGKVVVPGDVKASLLYARISHSNPALRMPPASSGKKLTPEQQEKLKLWIEQGAPWEEHWSFTPLTRPAVPQVSDPAWVRNPIDGFILSRLAAAKLKPAPEADKRTLIRRASLDITGLPPSPELLRDYLNDPSPDAYERAVDRLLNSLQYGEHRARYWLDAARYADTHGLHIDNYREMWLYRDWVINAFNRNMPFDHFTIEQLAGDLLPKPTLEQRIATGFNRCNVTTNEGGAIEEEVEAIYAKDRVEATTTVWLGLTAGCASCHDHKFDPIKQKDFYSFAAFFKNTTQRPMDGNIPDTPPVLTVPSPDDLPRWNELTAAIAERTREMDKLKQQSVETAASHRGEIRVDAPVDPQAEVYSLIPDACLNRPFPLTVGEGPMPGTKALTFGRKQDLGLDPLRSIDSETPFTISAWVYLPKSEENFTIVSQVERLPTFGEDDEDRRTRQGWSVEVNNRIPTLRLFGNTSIQVSGSNVRRLTLGEWTHLTFTYDGSRDARGMFLYVNGRPAVSESGANSRELKGSILANAPLRLGGDGGRYFNGGAIADLRIYGRELNPDEIRVVAGWLTLRAALGKDAGELTQNERELINLLHLTRTSPHYQELAAGLHKLESERRTIRYRSPITHVMQEKSGSTPTAHILYRGQYDQPREKVEAAVPGVLPPMKASLPRNRLGLAKWLMDPANPLTARVTVNRFWQEVFGTGLVRTTEDFGAQGEPPSHPELLDWLAVDFRESGWDVKRLFRLMLTSATYRQAAIASEEKLAADPQNRLLSRGPRFRMDGEVIRDAALFASGLLVAKIGGPSVKPYQPDGVWETVAMNGSNTRFYKQDSGDKLYRRSLYTFWKRSAPPASMDIFNAPTRENCLVRRERTNTPLQALVTLNDPQFVEAARHLADRALQSGNEFDVRLDAITMPVLARPFTARERAVAQRGLKDFMSHFDRDLAAARKLLGVGESRVREGADPVQLAAWTVLASDILNLDEALTK